MRSLIAIVKDFGTDTLRRVKGEKTTQKDFAQRYSYALKECDIQLKDHVINHQHPIAPKSELAARGLDLDRILIDVEPMHCHNGGTYFTQILSRFTKVIPADKLEQFGGIFFANQTQKTQEGNTIGEVIAESLEGKTNTEKREMLEIYAAVVYNLQEAEKIPTIAELFHPEQHVQIPDDTNYLRTDYSLFKFGGREHLKASEMRYLTKLIIDGGIEYAKKIAKAAEEKGEDFDMTKQIVAYKVNPDPEFNFLVALAPNEKTAIGWHNYWMDERKKILKFTVKQLTNKLGKLNKLYSVNKEVLTEFISPDSPFEKEQDYLIALSILYNTAEQNPTRVADVYEVCKQHLKPGRFGDSREELFSLSNHLDHHSMQDTYDRFLSFLLTEEQSHIEQTLQAIPPTKMDYIIRISETYRDQPKLRDQLIKTTNDHGIYSRPFLNTITSDTTKKLAQRDGGEDAVLLLARQYACKNTTESLPSTLKHMLSLDTQDLKAYCSIPSNNHA